MARILKRRGLYDVRGGTREPRPRDPGMTAQQAIGTASSALRLGTQVASLIGMIPVKDARAKKLEELETAKQVNATQQSELENQKKVAKANAMQRTPDVLVGAQQQAGAGVQKAIGAREQQRDAYSQQVNAAIAQGSRNAQAIALQKQPGLSFEEMTAITERISNQPLAGHAARGWTGKADVAPILPGQGGTPTSAPTRLGPAKASSPFPSYNTREDITRPNNAILNEAERIGSAFMPTEIERTVGLPAPTNAREKVAYDAMLRDEELERRGVLQEFSLNPKEKIVEIDNLWMKLRYMVPASVPEHENRVSEMRRLQESKNILLGMGRMGDKLQSESRFEVEQAGRAIDTSERELTEAQEELTEASAAVKGFESAQKGRFEGQQRVFTQREKALESDLAKIESQMPDLKRSLTDIIADAKFATTEAEKRKLMKEAASVINPRNVKESVFGVDELKLKAVEKVLKVMPSGLSQKDLEKILNAQELRAGRKQKREQSAEAWPDRLKKIQADSVYKQFKQQEQSAHNKLDLGIKKQRLSNMQMQRLKLKSDIAEKKDNPRRSEKDRKNMADYRAAVSATVTNWRQNTVIYNKQIQMALESGNRLRELRANEPPEYDDGYAKWKSDISKQIAIFNTYGGKTLERNRKAKAAIDNNLKILQQKAGFELKKPVNKDIEDFE